MADFSGHLRLRADRGKDGRTRLVEQSFRAPYHLSKSYWDFDTESLLVQVVNPTAGILAGDCLTTDVAVEAGAALLLTTPSASRVFHMTSGQATCHQKLAVAGGGWLEVWPEPVVPHRASVYQQRTELQLAADASAFYADVFLPGRLAHGEAFAWTRLVMELDVRRDGRRLLLERFDQSGAELKGLAEWAGAGGGACWGNAVFVAPAAVPDFPQWRGALQALQDQGKRLGVSALRAPGAWSIKFVAPDGGRARELVRQIRAILAPWAPHLRCDPRKL